MNILADASLPGLTAAFPRPFELTLYKTAAEIPLLIKNQDVLLCRSTLKVNQVLLPSSSLKYLATASSGSDHIDKHFLKSHSIKLLDAKGCNASSVADYVLACLAYLDEQHLIHGKKAGIIGMGIVGTCVQKRLNALNFNIKTYDPPKSDRDNSFKTYSLVELIDCDILCIHAELHHEAAHPSFNLLNQEFFKQLKPSCIIINAARGGIVNEEDLIHPSNQFIYCTDVYLNEPFIDRNIIDRALISTPHIAGHSLEAKYRAVEMISKQLHQELNLPFPEYLKPSVSEHYKQLKSPSWQQLILSLYNPVTETQQLKKALHQEKAFIALRKNHNLRHDFALNQQFSNDFLI